MTTVLRGYFRAFAAERLLTVIAARKRTVRYPPTFAIEGRMLVQVLCQQSQGLSPNGSQNKPLPHHAYSRATFVFREDG